MEGGTGSWEPLCQSPASAWLLPERYHLFTKMSVCRSTEGFSKLWSIHHQGPEDSGKSGGSVENQQTNFPLAVPGGHK